MKLLHEHNDVKIFLANSKTLKSDGIVFCIQPKLLKRSLWASNDQHLSEAISITTQLSQHIVNDPHFFEMWANIIIRKNGIFIYGRRINSPYWGKPITTIKSKFRFNKGGLAEIIKIISKIKFKNIVTPQQQIYSFSSPKHLDAEKIFWDERPPEKKKFVLFTSKKFIATLPLNPHLNGLHIQIFPRNTYWNTVDLFVAPWQIKKTDTNSAKILKSDIEIAFLAIKIIRSLKMKFIDIEYHMSGNWSGSLSKAKKSLSKKNIFNQKGAINTDHAFELKKIKKSLHLGGTGHGHIYAVKRGKINLPSRPQKEKPNEWKKIKQTSEKQAKVFQRIIVSKMK